MTSATQRQTGGTSDHVLADDSARRLTTETKAAFKTTEFIAYLGAVIAVIIVSLVVKHTDGHDDYFRADKALFYIVLLTIGYMVARGVAKAGSPERYDSTR